MPGFWPHVLEDASSNLGFDEHITPEDSEALNNLAKLNVSRPNVEKGDPRDVEISFTFLDNEYMPAQTVTKLFTHQSSDTAGLTGLISTPSLITWKAGKDLTSGVNQAAFDAFEERKAKAAKADGKTSNKLGPKEEKLLKLLKKFNPSFFTWFSFSGNHEELGETSENDAEGEQPMGPIEPFPYGDELAVQISDDVYPNAVKYFSMFSRYG